MVKRRHFKNKQELASSGDKTAELSSRPPQHYIKGAFLSMAESTDIPVQRVSVQRDIVLDIARYIQSIQEPASGRHRACFWIAAGFALVVWVLAVTAAVDDEWVYERLGSMSSEYGPGDSMIKGRCADTDRFSSLDFELACALYRGFTWMQYIATVMCSIAVAALALAAFLPARVGRCDISWALSLAVAGGMFMLGYVVFQLAAAVLVYIYVEEADNFPNDLVDGFQTTSGSSREVEYELRTTFWVAAVALALGAFTSIFLLACCCHAGNGPLWYYFRDDEGNAKHDGAACHHALKERCHIFCCGCINHCVKI